MTAPMVQEWSTLYAHELDNPAPGVQSAAQMTANLNSDIAAAQLAADVLYRRWLEPLTG
jgi:nitrogen-specific signal transduction histidine kinase